MIMNDSYWLLLRMSTIAPNKHLDPELSTDNYNTHIYSTITEQAPGLNSLIAKYITVFNMVDSWTSALLFQIPDQATGQWSNPQLLDNKYTWSWLQSNSTLAKEQIR